MNQTKAFFDENNKRYACVVVLNANLNKHAKSQRLPNYFAIYTRSMIFNLIH